MHTQPRSRAPFSALHARACRAVIAQEDGWQVLIHPRNTACYTARAGEGRLSLLLWHPQQHISVLVPSAASGFAYELLVPGQQPVRSLQYAEVARTLRGMGVSPLPPQTITRLYTHHVLMALVGATVPA